MPQNKTVVLLCGLPGSGKSTLAKEWAADDDRIAIIEYDDVQESLVDVNDDKGDATADGTNEEDRLLQAWRESRHKALNSLEESIHDDNISTTILDDNFFLRSMRKQVHQVCQRLVEHFAPSLNIYFGVVYLQTPVEVCLERNNTRTPSHRRIPEEVITRMQQRLEPPDRRKASWEQAILHLSNGRQNVSSLNEFVRSLPVTSSPVAPPVDPEMERQRLQMERQRTRDSALHRADQILRLCVQSVAKIRPRSGRAANQLRKNVYQEVKSSSSSGSLQVVIDDDDVSQVARRFVGQLVEQDASWTEEEIQCLEKGIDHCIAEKAYDLPPKEALRM